MQILSDTSCPTFGHSGCSHNIFSLIEPQGKVTDTFLRESHLGQLGKKRHALVGSRV